MVDTKYYIENIIEGTVLMNDGTWEQFLADNDHQEFSTYEDATQHIADVLSEGVYRIFSRITKS